MRSNEEYQPISWQVGVNNFFSGPHSDLKNVVSGYKRPESRKMKKNTIYFYYGTSKDEYRGLRCAFKNAKGEVIRLGLAATLNLAASDPTYASLKEDAKASVGKKSGLSSDQEEKLLRLIQWTAANSSKKDKNQSDKDRLTILNDQYDFLRDEFKAALEIRHRANKQLARLPGGFTKDQWHKKCDEFYEAGLKLWEATDKKNLPDDFHEYVVKGGDAFASMKEMVKDKVLGQKDLDGSKIFLINQVLERARRDVEFMPQASTSNRMPQEEWAKRQRKMLSKIPAHIKNLEQLNVLSKTVLGHSDPKMRKLGLILVGFAAAMAIVAALTVVPTFGLSALLPVALVAFLPFLSPALMGVAGLACVVLSREKEIASATFNYKQAVKSINQDIFPALKDRYENIDETSCLPNLFR